MRRISWKWRGGLTRYARKQPVSDSKTQYLTPRQLSEGWITSNWSGRQSGRATEKEIRKKQCQEKQTFACWDFQTRAANERSQNTAEMGERTWTCMFETVQPCVSLQKSIAGALVSGTTAVFIRLHCIGVDVWKRRGAAMKPAMKLIQT